ncbi:hypothetical protein QBC36DRAFT_156680, partial [Triangularia setosa]
DNHHRSNNNPHQHYHTTGTRRIPSWLNAIPSEAGGGSDAASRTGPSIASHHQQGPPPRCSSCQQPQQPAEKSGMPAQMNQSISPPRMKVRLHFNPPNQQLYSDTSVASSDPHNQFQTLPKLTTSTQPQSSSQQNSSQLQPFFSQPHSSQQRAPSPSNSQSVLEPLRQEIIGNFTQNCIACIFSPSSASPTLLCGRCQMIKSYVSQSCHTYRFLFLYLLPISEVFNYEEMLAYLNEVIVERVLAVEGKGNAGEEEKIVPTMDDFGVVVVKAKRRKE